MNTEETAIEIVEINRRHFIRLAGGALLALGGFDLIGCGGAGGIGGGSGVFGSSGSGSVSAQATTGSVTPPPGLAKTPLQVVGALTDGANITGGKYAVSVQSTVPSLVMVVNPANQKGVMMGMIDPTISTNNLDATNLAATLLFVALGGPQMTYDGRKPLLDLIKANPATATLATVVLAQLAIDPYALENANVPITNALATAVAAFASVSFASVPQSNPPQISTQSIAPQLALDPGNEVDGATFVQADGSLGFQVQNSKRRYAAVYTYLAGHTNAAGTSTPLTTPTQVGSILNVPETTSLLNLSNGWHPVTSDVVPLTLQGADSLTLYELIYLCPVFGASDPPMFQYARYSGEVAKWKQTLGDLQGAVFVDYISSIIFEGLGFGGLIWTYSQFSPIIAQLTTVSTSVATLLSDAQAGLPLAASARNMLQLVSVSDIVSGKVLQGLSPLLQQASARYAQQMAAGELAAVRYVALQAAIRIFIAVGIVALAADAAAVAKDTTLGGRGDLITASVFQPKVGITPASGTYSPGQEVTYHAQTPGANGLTLSYHWTYTGSDLAVFGDGTTNANSIVSSSATTTLLTSPSTQGTATVAVSVYDITGGANTLLGTATSVLTQGTANTQVLPVAYATWPVPSTPAWTFVMAYMAIPMDPTNPGEGFISVSISGVPEVTFGFDIPIAGAAVPVTGPGNGFIPPGGIKYLDPNNTTNYYVAPMNYGNLVVLQLFGGIASGAAGSTVGDIMAQGAALLATMKVTCATKFFPTGTNTTITGPTYSN